MTFTYACSSQITLFSEDSVCVHTYLHMWVGSLVCTNHSHMMYLMCYLIYLQVVLASELQTFMNSRLSILRIVHVDTMKANRSSLVYV